jgi:hypothetical protein
MTEPVVTDRRGERRRGAEARRDRREDRGGAARVRTSPLARDGEDAVAREPAELHQRLADGEYHGAFRSCTSPG